MKNDKSPKVVRVGGDVLQKMRPLGELTYPKFKKVKKKYAWNSTIPLTSHKKGKSRRKAAKNDKFKASKKR